MLFHESLLKETKGLLGWIFMVSSLCIFIYHYVLNSYYVVLIHPKHMQCKAIFSAVLFMCLWQKKGSHLGVDGFFRLAVQIPVLSLSR